MTPSLRDMPLLVANREGARWHVALPGGRTVSSTSKAKLEAMVAREVPFTLLRFAGPTPTGAARFVSGAGTRTLEGSDPGRRRTGHLVSGAG